MRIQIYPQPHEVDPGEKARVKEFLFKSLKNESAQWPDQIHCTIFVDGKTMRIMRGTEYQIYTKDIYVGHGPGVSPPHWVPGVMIAIMFFFRLETDQELVGLSIDLLGRVLSETIMPYQTLLVQNFNGIELEELAIDSETKTILAKFPPLEPGGPDRWVAANGEEIQFGSAHYSFPIPERR